MSLMIVSAAKSKVFIDEEECQGIQSLEYKVKRRQADIESIGWGERIGVENGQVVVTGSLKISSVNKKLDDLLYMPVPIPFNLVAELNKGDELIKKIVFDECYLDDKSFEMSANGVGVTVYKYTATRAREE